MEDFGENEEEIEKLKNIKLILYLNLAACYLKMKEFKNAKLICEEALKIDSKNKKAYFRRSKSLTLNINASKNKNN